MIASRTQASRKGRWTEQRLWQVLDQIPEGVVVCDTQGTITFANRAARLLYQHPNPEYLPLAKHSDVLQLCRPDGGRYPPEELPLSRSALEGVTLDNIEVIVRWPGAERIMLCNTTPLRGPSESIIGAIGVFRDITSFKEEEAEHRQLIRALEAQHGYLESILDQMPSGVLIAAASDGRDFICNTRFRELIDHPMRSVADIPIARIRHPDGTPYDLEDLALTRALRQGQFVPPREVLYVSKTGNHEALLASAAPVRDRSGHIIAAVLVLTSITRLAELEHLRESVLQVLAHELRNPLAAASALVQLVAGRVGASRPEPVDPEWLVERLRLAEVELERLRLLVNEVVVGYKVSRGALALDLEVLDLRGVAQEAVQSVEVVGAAKGFSITIEPGPPVTVDGDRRRLYDLLRSLLSNAVKYSNDGGRIWVSLSCDASAALVRVEDEGIGIPPDQLEKVFDLFAGARNLPHRHPEGIGLGLYVSREVARRHGGDLWAENRPGGGTVMCLRLPLAR